MIAKLTEYDIHIPVTEEWNHAYRPSQYFGYTRRPFDRHSPDGDRVTFSDAYSEEFGEPVWFYSWGNARWLGCPMGIPGDRLNDAGDYILAVDVRLIDGDWTFVVTMAQEVHCAVGT